MPRPWTLETAPRADRTFQQLWLEGRDRQALTEAVTEADAALVRDPAGLGELRMPERKAEEIGAEVRVAFFGPLLVRFLIEHRERQVTVLEIRRARPGPTRRDEL